MKILVIDVAAEYGGAVTILNQFIDEFKNNKVNHYIVVLSTLQYENSDNVSFINCKWVKKSHFHRLFFDKFFVNKLVEKYMPDRVFSLQNNAFPIKNIPQDVYFHNALPISEKRFSFFEAKHLWVYQNIIGNIVKNSLKYADRIFVQANWIKNSLIKRWKIKEQIIIVKRPKINLSFYKSAERKSIKGYELTLFYPANGNIYKNHLTLIKACNLIWKELDDKNKLKLVLTGTKNNLPLNCIKFINSEKCPISFVGNLNQYEMKDWYLRSILVYPSYLETFGLPLLEAKSLECNIIVSDCEYAHETIGRYDKVSYFPPFSVEALKKEILEHII